MTLKVSQYSNQFNEDSRFALSIDPIAESLAAFELIKDSETQRWIMASPVSIAIILLHLMLDDVLPKTETSQKESMQWHIIIQPKQAILCENILLKYCQMRSVKVIHDKSQMRDTQDSMLLMAVNLERSSFALYKPKFQLPRNSPSLPQPMPTTSPFSLNLKILDNNKDFNGLKKAPTLTISDFSNNGSSKKEEPDLDYSYDSICVCILLAQLHSRAQKDGVLSLFDQSNRNSLISIIIADAIANEKQNIFKNSIENNQKTMAYKNFASLLINEVTWKDVFSKLNCFQEEIHADKLTYLPHFRYPCKKPFLNLLPSESETE